MVDETASYVDAGKTYVMAKVCLRIMLLWNVVRDDGSMPWLRDIRGPTQVSGTERHHVPDIGLAEYLLSQA